MGQRSDIGGHRRPGMVSLQTRNGGTMKDDFSAIFSNVSGHDFIRIFPVCFIPSKYHKISNPRCRPRRCRCPLPRTPSMATRLGIVPCGSYRSPPPAAAEPCLSTRIWVGRGGGVLGLGFEQWRCKQWMPLHSKTKVRNITKYPVYTWTASYICTYLQR